MCGTRDIMRKGTCECAIRMQLSYSHGCNIRMCLFVRLSDTAILDANKYGAIKRTLRERYWYFPNQ